jgi:hypothetical protein
MLAPLDEALQMRPQLRHLDESKKPTKDEDMLDEEEKKPSFVTVGPVLMCNDALSFPASLLHTKVMINLTFV